MSAAWYWVELGIEPTRDSAIIRRAYATKLKVTRPEDDREGFDRLRKAYETAMQLARGEAPREKSPRALSPDTSAPVAPQRHVEAVAVRDEVAEQLAAAFRDLQRLLQADQGDSPRAHAALQAILRSPALENLSTEKEVEQRTALILASAIPASDSLLGMSCERFRWTDPEAELNQSPAIAAILRRVVDLQFLEELRSGRSPYSWGFRKLQQRKYPLISWVAAHVGKTGVAGEHQVLHYLRLNHPALLEHLEPTTVAWWDKLASRPRVSLAIVALGTIITAIGVVRGLEEGTVQAVLREAGPMAAVFTALALWKLFLIDWPRHIIREKRPVPSLLLTNGWLPISIALVVASALLPDSRTALMIIGIPAALMAQWAWIMGGLDPPSRSNLLSFPLLRAVIFNFLIVVWWIACASEMPPAGPVHVCVIAAVVASAVGLPATSWIWESRLNRRQRTAWLTASAALALSAGASLWWLATQPSHRPLCAALIVAAVVAIRPATTVLSNVQQKVRLGCVIACLIALIVAGVLFGPEFEARSGALFGAGALWVAAVLVSTLLAAWNERTGRIAPHRDDPPHESLQW